MRSRVFGFAALLTALMGGCQSTHPPLPVAQNVDIQRYTGTWYEIARLPTRFEQGCVGVTATYRVLKNGVLQVINTCREDSCAGEVEQAEGKAWIVDASTNAKLQVQFFWPFKGDYWILEVGPDYDYALVGAPSREYLWILSRTPSMPTELSERLLAKAEALDFNTSKLIKTEQCGPQ